MKRTCFFSLAVLFVFNVSIFGGNLEPSAPPGSTMKSLDQVEPRIPITSVPFTVSWSGSYYLTKNLTAAGTAITVNADDVTIDLCGFTLTGPGSGTNYGIYIHERFNVEIRNGTITNFGQDGVYESYAAMEHHHRIINVRLMYNNGAGLLLEGDGHLVKDCVVSGNHYGIYAGCESMMIGNTVTLNSEFITGDGYGIKAGHRSMISSNIVCWNGINADGYVYGIDSSDHCVISGNTVSDNGYEALGGSGIRAGDRCTINCNSVNSNHGKGIQTGKECSIIHNQISLNDSDGINASTTCVVTGCTVTANINKGISVADNSTVADCIASNNGSNGIWAGNYCTIMGNNCSKNTDGGIFCWSGTVVKNIASSNNQKDDSTLAGIIIWSASQVKENTCEDNKQNGLWIHNSGSTVETNFLRGSTNGIKFDGTGNYYKENRASGNTTAYANTAGNTDGGGNVSF